MNVYFDPQNIISSDDITLLHHCYYVHEDPLNSLLTDRSDILNTITNSMNWPAFTSEIDTFQSLQENFEKARLLYISCNENGWTDQLAKEARNKNIIFSHINQARSDRNIIRRNISPDQHLV